MARPVREVARAVSYQVLQLSDVCNVRFIRVIQGYLYVRRCIFVGPGSPTGVCIITSAVTLAYGRLRV